MQTTVVISLILAHSNETESRGIGACPADRDTEGVLERAVVVAGDGCRPLSYMLVEHLPIPYCSRS